MDREEQKRRQYLRDLTKPFKDRLDCIKDAVNEIADDVGGDPDPTQNPEASTHLEPACYTDAAGNKRQVMLHMTVNESGATVASFLQEINGAPLTPEAGSTYNVGDCSNGSCATCRG